MAINILFCENPEKPLRKDDYCSYYGEIFYALKEQCNITFTPKTPSKVSDLGSNWDAIILGFGQTEIGDRKPHPLIQDTSIPIFPILNKEYVGLENKLNWIKSMNATAGLTVHHEAKKFTKITGIPFHRFMWSSNENLFKDYGDDYSYDLFYSGVIRPEQTENFREKILSDMSILHKYKVSLNIRSHKNKFAGKILPPYNYAKKLASSKICFITTGPADLVGTRYFEVMAGNRSLILCNRMNKKVYEDMLIDGFNCVMFSSKEEFFEKAIYYLEHETERMKIVNQAYNHFINSQTWQHRAKQILNIINKYI
jgi:glycosyltransferase involved in cell wall biosynthesis